MNRRITATVAIASGARFLASGEDSIWVLNHINGKVRRVDAQSGDVLAAIETMAIGNGGDIATGGGWVTTPRVPVIKIGPQTNTVAGSFRAGWKVDGRCDSLVAAGHFGSPVLQSPESCPWCNSTIVPKLAN